MPTEGTDFHGIDGVKAFSSNHPSSEIGNASNTFMFCVFRAFRGPLFRNLGSPAQPDSGLRYHGGSGATAPFRESSFTRCQSRARPQFDGRKIGRGVLNPP
jgi:hypothetical protein